MGEISRSTVGIRIFGNDLNPDEITEQLDYPPTDVAKTGDIKIKPEGGQDN